MSLVQEDKGKNSFFPGNLAERLQELLECEANEHDSWATIAFSCCSYKSTKCYALHLQEKKPRVPLYFCLITTMFIMISLIDLVTKVTEKDINSL